MNDAASAEVAGIVHDYAERIRGKQAHQVKRRKVASEDEEEGFRPLVFDSAMQRVRRKKTRDELCTCEYDGRNRVLWQEANGWNRITYERMIERRDIIQRENYASLQAELESCRY